MVQVRAERATCHRRVEVEIGGGDDADIGTPHAHRPQTAEGVGIQDMQEFGLRF